MVHRLAPSCPTRLSFDLVWPAPNPQSALETLGGRLPDVVLLDANFARGATDAAEGLAWLGRLLAYDPDMAVVMITAHAGLQVAVAAMKRGVRGDHQDRKSTRLNSSH